MYAQLGDLEFRNLLGINRFDRSGGLTIVEHSRINGKPRLEKTGLELDSIVLEVKLHKSFASCEEVRDKISDWMNEGAILPFITGTGVIYGDFIIKSLSESHTQALKNGVLISTTLTIGLVESWRERDISDIEIDSFALKTDDPPLISALQPSPLEGFQSTEQMLSINAESIAGIELLENGNSEDVFMKARRNFLAAKKAVSKLKATLEESQHDVQQFIDATVGYKNAAESIIDSLTVGDGASIQSRLFDIRHALGVMSTSSETYSLLLILRKI